MFNREGQTSPLPAKKNHEKTNSLCFINVPVDFKDYKK
jgi:hypothetical protein